MRCSAISTSCERKLRDVADTEPDVAALIRQHGPDGAEKALIAQGWDARSAAEVVALELGEDAEGDL